jgi:hypothetical protein
MEYVKKDVLAPLFTHNKQKKQKAIHEYNKIFLGGDCNKIPKIKRFWTITMIAFMRLNGPCKRILTKWKKYVVMFYSQRILHAWIHCLIIVKRSNTYLEKEYYILFRNILFSLILTFVRVKAECLQMSHTF